MKCKRLVIKSSEDQTKIITLYGIVTKEDNIFIYFKTANKNYMFNRNKIEELSDTDIEFNG